MSDWRHYILRHFRQPIHRLTLVADPDGLMLEEEVLAAIRRNGFDLLPFEDPVAFRYAYESRYRQYWDESTDRELEADADLVVVLHSYEASLRALPYDLLMSGRTLTFGLSDLFPKLSYPVVKDLDVSYLQRLYEAYQGYTGPGMGDRASALFLLRHVFGVAPDTIKTPSSFLRILLSRHIRGEQVPQRLDKLLLRSLRRQLPQKWPLENLLRSSAEFFSFLQGQWASYLAAQQSAEAVAREPGQVYDTGELVPFDDPDVRAYIDTLFIDGRLEPVSIPEDWSVEGWARVGVQYDEHEFERRRFSQLLKSLKDDVPAVDASHKDWVLFARRWAELTVLRYRLASELGGEAQAQFSSLHIRIEQQFADWMVMRYHALHNLPFLPKPVMVHRVAQYMATRYGDHPKSRLALVVVDGLALDQWLIIREAWADEERSWLLEANALFAWVPTLTPISRQAIFAGTSPQFFPNSWRTTAKEVSHWQRFWREQGCHPGTVGYLRNLGVKEVPKKQLGDRGGSKHSDPLEPSLHELLDDPHVKVVGLVLNTVDNIMHGMQLGTAGMHQQVRQWTREHQYLSTLVGKLLEESFRVYLTSDHGNVWARGIGRPSEGVLVEKRGERARIYTDSAFLDSAKEQTPSALEWTNVGLPASLRVLLAPGRDAFSNEGQQSVCHGGIALEEVIVPFIEITQK